MTNGLTAKAFSVLAHSTLKDGAMSKFWQQFEQHKRVVGGDIVETEFPFPVVARRPSLPPRAAELHAIDGRAGRTQAANATTEI